MDIDWWYFRISETNGKFFMRPKKKKKIKRWDMLPTKECWLDKPKRKARDDEIVSLTWWRENNNEEWIKIKFFFRQNLRVLS